MAIAVSALLRPSRLFLCFAACTSATVALIGFLIALGQIGELPPVSKYLISSLCFLSAFISFHKFSRSRKTLRIDISGIGQIRLTHYSVLDRQQKKFQAAPCESRVVELIEGSTLWSFLLVLRLKDEDGGVQIVTVLPDCVSSTGFKSLSVALRWIAARQNPVAQ